jgi:flagellar export protein FliJ
MKRYKFRLETVLRVRRLQEEQAKNDLLAANQQLQRAESALAMRQSAYAEIQMQLGMVNVDEFASARWKWEQAARAIEIAQLIVLEQVNKVKIAREAYLVASRAVEILERLDLRRREEHALEVARAETTEVDDLVNGRRAYVLQASAT